MAEFMLVTEALCKDFIGLRAINNIDIAVKRGDIHGLIGPNGSGKSTFFNVLSGVLKATAGKIFFDSVEITGFKPHIIARMGMCRTFQSGKLACNLTVLENVMAGAHSRTRNDVPGTFFRVPFTVSRQEKRIREMAVRSLELVGLLERADNFASDLVWVERQMVQIARAMVAEPKLLLMDEPTGGMGEEESVEILESSGADLTRVVISHAGHFPFSRDTIKGLAKRGCCIEFDTFGHPALPIECFTHESKLLEMPSEVQRIYHIRELISEGFLDRILISQDCCFKHKYVKYGGYGYAHILEHIVPWMKQRDIREEQLHTIVVENPKRILTLNEPKL
jgi:branched-chain amino acid transport system ATP-binding protein